MIDKVLNINNAHHRHKSIETRKKQDHNKLSKSQKVDQPIVGEEPSDEYKRKVRELFERSRQYCHKQMENCLKPINLENVITLNEHYQTETKRQFQPLKSSLVQKPAHVTRDGCISPATQIAQMRRA